MSKLRLSHLINFGEKGNASPKGTTLFGLNLLFVLSPRPPILSYALDRHWIDNKILDFSSFLPTISRHFRRLYNSSVFS